MIEATIFAALRLPSGVLSSLESGSITAIHAQSCNRPNQDFALCIDDSEASEVTISLWARCETSLQFFEKDKCDILSSYLQVPVESLQTAIEINGFIWISYLRVYHLSSPVVIKNNAKGAFLALENRIYIDKLQPVLDGITYTNRKAEVKDLKPPEPLCIQIQKTLEQSELKNKLKIKIELEWINKIAQIGNSSDGNLFEKLVRKSMLVLGFTGSGLNPEGSGGAGGMDLYAEFPYPVVGECKATKTEKVSDGTPAQLLKIGTNHLGKKLYERSIKLIVAAGELNSFAQRTARENEMNVIRPETLEKLVNLQTSYLGSVDLTKLKACLEKEPFGEDANLKLLDFIDKVKDEIKLRSHIVQLVKTYLSNKSMADVALDGLQGAYDFSNPPKNLTRAELREILIELSSPLAGYLGRVEEDRKKCDRFYYLRDLLT